MVGAVAQSLPEPGDTLAGKYRIVRTLGEGGMGIVYQAKHLRLNQDVAIKMLKQEMRKFSDIVARFKREARTVARLRGDHVANVIDVDVLEDGSPFMVMEYLEGRDLGDELEARGPLPFGEAVDYVIQTCAAMAEAHQCKIIHRDLKPSNLFLCGKGEQRTIKVLDFGISKMHVESDNSLTMTTSGLGTPLYMSPEHIRSAKHVDERTDIWSLGVILYELLTGEPPFMGSTSTAVAASITADTPEPIASYRSDVPQELEAVVMATLQKLPAKRPASAEALAQALLPFAGNKTSWSPPPAHSAASVPSSQENSGVRSFSQAPTVINEARRRGQATATGWVNSARQAKRVRERLVAVVLVVGVISVGGYRIFMSGSRSQADMAQARAGAAVQSEPRATAVAEPAPVRPATQPAMVPPPASASAPTQSKAEARPAVHQAKPRAVKKQSVPPSPVASPAPSARPTPAPAAPARAAPPTPPAPTLNPSYL